MIYKDDITEEEVEEYEEQQRVRAEALRDEREGR
jgi:hypothetical protein